MTQQTNRFRFLCESLIPSHTSGFGISHPNKRRIKTQCVLPTAETAGMLFWALLACGQITLRRIDGWDTLHVEPDQQPLDLAA